ncbi:MAG: tRNA-modifying protein YgfZ, partial [Burkholderiales bacterium]
LVMFGIAGPQAPACLGKVLAAVPGQVFELTHADGMALVNLPGGRYLLICQADQASAVWLKLSAHLYPAGWNWWQLQTIRAGIATVTQPTQEAFIPQMLGLDAYAAVSFSKGCYPGQEIVARTRYLGDLKRHLYYGRCNKSLAAGETIVDSGSGESLGTVTDAAINPGQGCEFLAVLRKDALEPATQLRSSSGAGITSVSAVADRLARSSS